MQVVLRLHILRGQMCREHLADQRRLGHPDENVPWVMTGKMEYQMTKTPLSGGPKSARRLQTLLLATVAMLAHIISTIGRSLDQRQTTDINLVLAALWTLQN